MDTIWAQLMQTSNYEARAALVLQFNAANQWKKRGISMVPVRWEAGWQGDHQSAMVNIYPDGSVLVCHSGVEIGQGIDTKVET
jgi:xanthine dehydrogenase/oxidase